MGVRTPGQHRRGDRTGLKGCAAASISYTGSLEPDIALPRRHLLAFRFLTDMITEAENREAMGETS